MNNPQGFDMAGVLQALQDPDRQEEMIQRAVRLGIRPPAFNTPEQLIAAINAHQTPQLGMTQGGAQPYMPDDPSTQLGMLLGGDNA